MLLKSTFLSLIPKYYCRICIQRQIRCCGALLAKPEKKENFFQHYRNEMERWKKEENEGKTWSQFQEELKQRHKCEEENLAIFADFKRKFPHAYELCFLVKNGAVSLFKDVKTILQLNYSLFKGNRKFYDLNLHELNILYEVYFHVKKMIPIILLLILPFGNFVVIILAYMKPLTLLSPHFWSEKHKAIFTKHEHANRVLVFSPLINYVETNLPSCTKFHNVLKSVKNGHVPTAAELVTGIQLFADDDIFCLEKLPSSHLVGCSHQPHSIGPPGDNLLKLHGQTSFFMKKKTLNKWVSYLRFVDLCIKRSGGVPKLSPELLKKYCFQRGVNANTMTEEEMRIYLNQWLELSEHISGNNSTFLLHAPALLGFSHKSNKLVTSDDLF